MRASARAPGRASERIIVALDVPTRGRALAVARSLRGRPGFFKVGSRLFTAIGPEIVRALARRDERVFLDLKFHDIPSVVAEACVEAADWGARLITVHAAGGPRMLRAARRALEKHCRSRRRPRLLGVTVLTSLDEREAKTIGLAGGVRPSILRLARLAQRHGCDGVIAAPTDVRALRRACGRNFLLVTPGIRSAGGRRAADQRRVATAGEAIRAGADYVVVGRALLEAWSAARAFAALAQEIASGLRRAGSPGGE